MRTHGLHAAVVLQQLGQLVAPIGAVEVAHEAAEELEVLHPTIRMTDVGP